MSRPTASHTDDVLREAAQWFAVLYSGDAQDADRQRWRDWLGAGGSPQRQAWARVEHISQRFGNLGDGAARGTLHRRNGPPRRGVLRALALVGGTGLLAWGGSRTNAWQDWRADYSSATGEIREITLADGSTLWLDTGSAVDVDFSGGLRRLVLRRGGISITTAQPAAGIAPDPRPLVVDGAHGRMRALGTRFTVRQHDANTLLAVFQGAVQVHPARAGTPARVIAAGQQVRFSASEFGDVLPASGAQQAWTRGLLIAADMPLAEFTAELARYRRGHLACSEAVAGLRLVGVYPLRDTDQALAALARALPVRIRQRTRWWVTVEPMA